MNKVKFHLGLAATILVVVSTATVLTLGQVWMLGSQAVQTSVTSLFSEIAARTGERVRGQIGSALTAAELGSASPASAVPIEGDGLDHPGLGLMRRILDIDPTLYGVYVGWSDGSFLQLIRVRNRKGVLDVHNAPATTEEILRVIESNSGRRMVHWIFLGPDGSLLERRDEADPVYDPRARPWYTLARDSAMAVLSDPYVFNSLQQPGITAARRLLNDNGVFAVDITLDTLDIFVSEQRVSERGAVVLLDGTGRLLGAPASLKGNGSHVLAPLTPVDQAGHPLLKVVAHLREFINKNNNDVVTVIRDGEEYIARLARLAPWQAAIGAGGRELVIAVVAPLADFTASVRTMGWAILLVTVIVLLVVLPLTTVLAGTMARTVRSLAEEADRIRDMDFSGVVPAGSFIREIHSLAAAFGVMKTTILDRSRELEEAQAKLARLVEVGITMGVEDDDDRLAALIVQEAKGLSTADGGVLWLRDAEGRLRIRYLSIDSLGLTLSEGDSGPLHLPIIIDKAADEPLWAAMEQHRSVSIGNLQAAAPLAELHGNSQHWVQGFAQRTGYHAVSLLVVPLLPRGDEPLGVLLLLNARPPGLAQPTAFSPAEQRFVESLAAQAATALHNRDLLLAQQALLEAIVRVIADAVDAKSPHTGGHASRVPELAMMLAEEASAAREGPLAEFALTTPEQWREFRIAAWMHDCGKVTTPESVVEKSTKLETLYNRIHEIRTRFEVLLRDAEIERLEAVIRGDDPAEAAARYEQRFRTLTDDFVFVASCNLGTEAMTPARVSRLRQIAATPWMRHFDDRLGLGAEELARFSGETPALPVRETLIADRPEHRVPWTGKEPFHRPDWRFTTAVPSFMYNRGELYNLGVIRGTLTEEERFKITEHVIQTILMLERLPFPKSLRRVPEYAGGHHETLDGRGYPRSLSGTEISMPARIIAIADIFEALTAADRPYKSAKTVSEAVAILAGMRDRQHIDPALFALFLRSGVHLRYAQRFLKPEQIDTCRIEDYLGESDGRANPDGGGGGSGVVQSAA